MTASLSKTRKPACLPALAILTALASPASALTLLIDLNTNAGSPLPPGNTWNSYATPADITGATLLDSSGSTTGITFNKTGTITDNTSNGGLAIFNPNQPGVEGLPSWVTTTTEAGAAADNFFTSNSGAVAHTFTLTFGDLTPGHTFSLDLLASRNSGSALGFFEYSLDGGTTWTGFTVLNADGTPATTDGWDTATTVDQFFNLQTQGFQLHRYMNASDITLTGTTLDVRTRDANALGPTFSAMNALRLEIIPEPSALLLTAPTLAFSLTRRNRKSRSDS